MPIAEVCAEGERERFREAEVETEGQRGRVEKLRQVVVAKHSYIKFGNYR